MPEKKKQWKRNFLIILFYFYQSKHFVCFFNYQSCKCGQLTHNYIKRDLGDSNFSYSYSYIEDYGCTPQEPIAHIHTYS